MKIKNKYLLAVKIEGKTVIYEFEKESNRKGAMNDLNKTGLGFELATAEKK